MLNIIQIILLLLIIWEVAHGKGGQSILAALGFGKRSRKIIVDSCGLIDGRIIEIVNSGFVADELIIPQFILNELQMLADGNDTHKRERARFGLDIAHQLQDSTPIQVTVDHTVLPNAPETVDDRLVALAKRLRACLYTTDFNLGKVAAVEGITVLNVNGLSSGLRPVALPGETLRIKLIQKGSSRDQGVGYLEDGTMIVVDGAARFIGKVMPVTVTRMHQTVAGKMVFGQVKNNPEDRDDANADNKQTPKEDTRREPQAQQMNRQKNNRPQHQLQRRLKGMMRPKNPERTI